MKTLIAAALCAAVLTGCAAAQSRETTGQYLGDTAITSKVKAELLAKEGTETAASASPADFAAFLAQDAKLWARLVSDSGAKFD